VLAAGPSNNSLNSALLTDAVTSGPAAHLFVVQRYNDKLTINYTTSSYKHVFSGGSTTTQV
jgi:hypothetical protein